MEDHLAYWLTVKLILQIIVCVVAYVLWNYLASKPLGQQTVLDMMIQDHIITSIVNNFTSGLIYLKFSDKYSHDMAMTLLAANQAALMGYLVQIMMIIIIRYLYIFHPGFMNETNDNVVILVTRSFLGLGALASVFLNDYGGEGGLEYNHLINSDFKKLQKSPTLWLTKGVVISNILLLLYTQARIELFKIQTHPSESINNLNRRKRKFRNKHSLFGSKHVAITLVLVLVFFLIILDLFIFPGSTDNVTKVLRTRVISSLIMQILFPLLWIRKNKKIQDFFFRTFFNRDTRRVVPNVIVK